MAGGFADRLLTWFDHERRDLPWRRTADAWAIWVSEVMLQQTRVDVVRDAWARFVARYPDPAAFARASDDDLHAAWRGLGYYRRARLLRDGARQVVDRHDGRVPESPDAIGALAGVGDYTRGAIASIAFGHAVAAIDGNVERVYARHRGITTNVKTAAGRRAVEAAVLADLDAGRAGDFNQALMDLGATVCTPRRPRCDACPVATDCVAHADGTQDTLPVLPKRRAAVDVHARMLVVARDAGAVLAARVPAGEPNAGQVELPTAGVLVDTAADDAADLAGRLADRYETRFAVGAELGRVKHGITHHRITLAVHAADVRGRVGTALFDAGPHDPEIAWTTPSRKALARVFGATADGPGRGTT